MGCDKMLEIKAAVLDIDGVIIGKKEGINFPVPNERVIDKLIQVRKNGIGLYLCTAKPSFSIKEVVEKAGLDSFHIVNGGGLIINPISNKILKKYVIDKDVARKLVELCLSNNIRIEASSINNYYVFIGNDVELTKKREAILRKKAIIISSIDEIGDEEIIEFKVIAHEKKRDLITKLLERESINLSINWTFHPAILPLHTGSINVKGISKKQGFIDLFNDLGISFDNILGIGDGINDWNFMQLCKYTAAMGNDKELQEKVLSVDGYIGSDVDNDGIIYILDYFLNNKGGEGK